MHEAKAMILSCMDFRLVDDTAVKLKELGYIDNYDIFIMAGASLGYNGIPGFSGWADRFNEHVGLAIGLHNIEEIIIIDHMKCGAYGKVYSSADLAVNEMERHRTNLREAAKTLKEAFSTLKIKGFVIGIEGDTLTQVEGGDLEPPATGAPILLPTCACEGGIENQKYIMCRKPLVQSTMHHARAMILSCMDFRLVDDMIVRLNEIGYIDNYDAFVLAGASLGYNGIRYTEGWGAQFNEHVRLAIGLHDIKEIIMIDHMKCGAYTLHYGDVAGTYEEEQHHKNNLAAAAKTLHAEFPDLTIKAFLIDIEGTALTQITDDTEVPDNILANFSYNFTYEEVNGTLDKTIITGLTPSDVWGAVIVPEGTITIGTGAFANQPNVRSVTFPETLLVIKPGACSNMPYLKEVILPDSIESIGDDAFNGCSRLESLTLPSNISFIGANAFEGCSSLTHIEIPNGDVGEGGLLGGVMTVVIPLTIGAQCFKGCLEVTSVRFLGNNPPMAEDDVFVDNNDRPLNIYADVPVGWPAQTLTVGGLTVRFPTDLANINVLTPPSSNVLLNLYDGANYYQATYAGTDNASLNAALTTALTTKDCNKIITPVRLHNQATATLTPVQLAKIEDYRTSDPVFVDKSGGTGFRIIADLKNSNGPDNVPLSAVILVTEFDINGHMNAYFRVYDNAGHIVSEDFVVNITIVCDGLDNTLTEYVISHFDDNDAPTDDRIANRSFGTDNFTFKLTKNASISGTPRVGNMGCFLAGTPVLTPSGPRAIETISKGDLVVTSDGRTVPVISLYRKPLQRTCAATAPYFIPAGCIGSQLPRSDLIMSPGHCFQVDAAEDLWLPASKCARLSSAVKQIHLGESITYYNLKLPNYFTDNLVVFDGVVVESINPRKLEFNKEKRAYSRRVITTA